MAHSFSSNALFFFSSRRRHTRSLCDWSSDVCSSDLKIIFTALALCLGVLNGCGATRPSKYYQLTVPSDKTSSAEPAPYPVTLLLGPIVTSNLYRDDRIVYTSGGEAMGTYEFQRWAEPPAEMIKDVLLRELQASTRYQYVYSSRSDVRGDY